MWTIIEPSWGFTICDGSTGRYIVLQSILVQIGGFESWFTGSTENTEIGSNCWSYLIGIDYSETTISWEGPFCLINSKGWIIWCQTFDGFILVLLKEFLTKWNWESIFLKRNEIIILNLDSNKRYLRSVCTNMTWAQSLKVRM